MTLCLSWNRTAPSNSNSTPQFVITEFESQAIRDLLLELRSGCKKATVLLFVGVVRKKNHHVLFQD
jgi:hypothetical protein